MMNYLLLATAYLLGSIPFGVVLARARNINLRSEGSGNIGATNVARVLGKKAGLLTLCGDMAKGAVAVALADHWMANAEWVALAGLMAFLGHLHSVFIGFKGGKGVATALGIYLVLAPLAVCLALLVFIALLWKWRYVSLASVSAAAVLPFIAYALHRDIGMLLASLFISGMVIARHRENIRRLLAGTENRFNL